MQRTVSACPAGATISASVHAPFPEHVSVQSAPSAHVFTLLSHASSPTQSHTLSPSHECALGSSAPAEGDPEGDAVGLADGARVGARVGAAETVGAAVVGAGVGLQAPSVFLMPQVPPLLPVLKMQGE